MKQVYCMTCKKYTENDYPMILQRYNINKIHYQTKCNECGFIKSVHFLQKPDLYTINRKAFQIPLKQMYLNQIDGIPIPQILS
jgi:hypothetical protein